MYRVPVVVVVEVMFGSPSIRIQVSYRTETCTTSDTSLPTWYRTTQLTCPAGAGSGASRTAYLPAGFGPLVTAQPLGKSEPCGPEAQE